MSLPRLAALVAALTLTATAPAAADSIAYVKNGDVWLASPDGARQVQVTRTGGYASVSQADDGTMIALAPRERLHRLARTGEVLADFPTFVSDGAPTSGPVNEFHGPFDPEISPDGKLVAFEWYNETYSNGTSCNESSVPPCAVLTSRQGVGITRADGFTGFEDYGILTGWIDPMWTANDMLLRSGVQTILNEDAVFTRVGPGKGDGELRRWFWDNAGGLGVEDVELSRDQKVVVGVAGYSDELLRIYRPLHDPYNAPAQDLHPWGTNTPVIEKCVELTGPAGGKFASPTLAPDGRGLAYADGDGVWTTAVPDLAGGCAGGDRGRLLAGGASSPDWGPADVPVIAPTRADAAPAVKGAQPGSQAGGAARPRTVRLTVAPTRLRSALRSGLVVRVRGASGRVVVTALRGTAQVGSGRATARRDGTATVRIRFTARARRTLGARRSVRLALRVGSGAGATAPAAAVTLRR